MKMILICYHMQRTHTVCLYCLQFIGNLREHQKVPIKAKYQLSLSLQGIFILKLKINVNFNLSLFFVIRLALNGEVLQTEGFVRLAIFGENILNSLRVFMYVFRQYTLP